ncbi:hypothetical protein LOK49_LG12G01847 [Camellia lanceoleosa]|uniref:Uncharacterized protein n=1 Tax=Camellia lanceoleosa TaxID=1840588 RepID=A0ACC0FT02_9ERIC|nr:hypothetical protein LOK49_LG12G01847 [Camellia lanceoleosa]
MKRALEMEEIRQIRQSKSVAPQLFQVSNLPKYLNMSALSRYTLTTIVPKRRPRIGRSMAAYACSGVITWKITINMAPKRDPIVLSMASKGTAGKTANT